MRVPRDGPKFQPTGCGSAGDTSGDRAAGSLQGHRSRLYQVVGPVGYTYPGLKIFFRVVQSVNQTFFILEICS